MTKEEILAECKKVFESYNSNEWEFCKDCSRCKDDCWKFCGVVMKAMHNKDRDKEENVSLLNRKARVVNENEFADDVANIDDSEKSEEEQLADETYVDHSLDDKYGDADDYNREEYPNIPSWGNISMTKSSGYDDFEGFNGYCSDNEW